MRWEKKKNRKKKKKKEKRLGEVPTKSTIQLQATSRGCNYSIKTESGGDWGFCAG